MRKAALILIFAGCIAAGPACPSVRASSWSGVDETVIETIAEKAGRPAREPFINTDRGDLLLFVFLVAGVVGGFIAGYNFRVLFPPKRRGEGKREGRSHSMFELFSDIFTYRDNVLTRIDPRVKLAIAFAALVAVVTAERFALPLLVFGACLGGVVALRLPATLVAVRLAAPLSIVAVLVVFKTFLTGATPLFVFSAGGWTFTATAEGLTQGTLLGARVLGAVSVILLLSSVTPAHRIFQALRSFGISRNWLEIAILMYRYIFVLMGRAANIAAAQRLRLGYTAQGHPLRCFAALAGATIVHSFEQAERTHDAMRLRGYRGAIPFGPLPAVTGRDRRILILCLTLIAVTYGLLEWGMDI